MSDTTNINIDDILKTPKKVTSEAGSVETISVDEAIKLAEYKEKRKTKANKRIAWGVTKHREF